MVMGKAGLQGLNLDIRKILLGPCTLAIPYRFVVVETDSKGRYCFEIERVI